MANTYAKYCPNVYLAKCDEKHEKGEIIYVENKYGRENEHIVHNLILERDGFFYYSITRADGYNAQERAKAKAERYEEIAARAQARGGEYSQKATAAVAGIEPGQPILVDHYSGKYHRRAIEKSDAAMGHAVEEYEKADMYAHKAEAWRKHENVVNLSMPESIEYYAARVEKLEELHKFLLEHPEKRPHSFALTYAKKDVNEARKNLEIAKRLWA